MTRDEALERMGSSLPASRLVKFKDRRGVWRYARLTEVLTKWAVVESGDDEIGISSRRVKIADLAPYHKDL